MKLTPKQDNFCKCVASGMTQADAYRSAYGQKNMNDNTLTVKASNMMAKDNVRIRVTELRELSTNSAILSIIERKEWLTKIVTHKDTEDDKVFNGDKIRALDILNKMDGAYAPIKLESELTGTMVVRNITVNPTKAK